MNQSRKSLNDGDFIVAAMSKDLNFDNAKSEEEEFILSIVGVKNLTDKTLSPFRYSV